MLMEEGCTDGILGWLCMETGEAELRRKWGERSLFFLKMGDLARGCSDGDALSRGIESESLAQMQEAGLGGQSRASAPHTPGILNRWALAVWGEWFCPVHLGCGAASLASALRLLLANQPASHDHVPLSGRGLLRTTV